MCELNSIADVRENIWDSRIGTSSKGVAETDISGDPVLRSVSPQIDCRKDGRGPL